MIDEEIQFTLDDVRKKLSESSFDFKSKKMDDYIDEIKLTHNRVLMTLVTEEKNDVK